ncbi:Sorting nexin-14 [Homalodisca vitripennis]|nr:Sorting nexin-14 [Homalodisca vitripennis]
MFTINIQRIDVTQGDSSQWTVERRLTDFYSLDAKLTEFHGEFPDAQLPSRRTIANCTSPSGRPESVQIYEEYLQKLLSKPALRGSDLLFSFLACPGEFVAEDSALGRLLRRGVPLSLRKERGQHLEPFIATFIASTESRVRHSKIEYKDMSQEMSPRHIRKITSSVFGDNFGLHLPPELPEKPSKSTQTPFTPTHCCIYFGVNVLQWSQTTIKFAIALQKLFGNTVDAILQYWLNAKLKRLLVPQRVAHLVKLLQWAIFESRGKSDRAQVARAVELQLREKGEWTRPIYQGMFVAAQAPLLNKQNSTSRSAFSALYGVMLDTSSNDGLLAAAIATSIADGDVSVLLSVELQLVVLSARQATASGRLSSAPPCDASVTLYINLTGI